MFLFDAVHQVCLHISEENEILIQRFDIILIGLFLRTSGLTVHKNFMTESKKENSIKNYKPTDPEMVQAQKDLAKMSNYLIV